MAGTPQTRPRVGEPFNPYQRFNNVLVPEAMARNRELSPAAKLIYGRLRRYAGKDGRCFPRVDTLGEEVGLGERQTQKHLRTLEREGYIRTVERFTADGAQTSNGYAFLWHPTFDEWEENMKTNSKGVNSGSPSPMKKRSPTPVNSNSPKEGQYEEGQVEEVEPDSVYSDSPEEGQMEPVNFGDWDNFYK